MGLCCRRKASVSSYYLIMRLSKSFYINLTKVVVSNRSNVKRLPLRFRGEALPAFLPIATTIPSNSLCSLKAVHRTRNPEHHSSCPVLESSSTLNLGVQLPAVFGCHQAPALDFFNDLINELQGKGNGELCAEASKLSGGIVPEVPLRDYDDNST
jgi:hypothetical protein